MRLLGRNSHGGGERAGSAGPPDPVCLQRDSIIHTDQRREVGTNAREPSSISRPRLGGRDRSQRERAGLPTVGFLLHFYGSHAVYVPLERVELHSHSSYERICSWQCDNSSSWEKRAHASAVKAGTL